MTKYLLLLMCFGFGPLATQAQNLLYENPRVEAYMDASYLGYMDQESTHEVLRDLYASVYLRKGPQADSLYHLVSGMSFRQSTPLDSLSYHAVVGYYQVFTHAYPQAVDHLNRAAHLAAEYGTTVHADWVRSLRAGLDYYMSRYEEGLAGFRELALSDKEVHPLLRAKSLVNYATLLQEELAQLEGHAKDSLASLIGGMYRTGLELYEQTGDMGGLAHTHAVLIPMAWVWGGLDSALVHTREAQSAAARMGWSGKMAFTQIKIGQVLSEGGQYLRATDSVNKALAYHQRHNEQNEVRHCYNVLQRIYAKAGLWEQAHQAADQSLAVYQQLHSEEMARAAARYEVAFNTQQTRLALLEEEQLSAQQALTIQRRNRWLWALGALVLIGVSIGIALISRSKRLSEAHTNQVVLEERRQGMEAVLRATEDERKRIAKDLHDGVVQQMGAVRMLLASQLNQANPNSRETLERAMELAEQTAADTRGISHDMMPAVLLEGGLVPAMEGVLETTLPPAQVTFGFETNCGDRRFEDRLEVSLYRIFQELIQNVVKHSQAQRVNVELLAAGNQLVLLVEDDGVGLPVRRSPGLGLRGIETRLQVLNGALELASEPNKGTVATIVVPL